MLGVHGIGLHILDREKLGIDLRDYLEDFSIQTGVYVSDVKHSSTHLKFEDEYGKRHSRRAQPDEQLGAYG